LRRQGDPVAVRPRDPVSGKWGERMSESSEVVRTAELRWGPLALATLITCWSVWYFWDAYTASSRIQNLIFIAPLVATMLVLFAIELFTTLFRPSASVEEDDPVVAASTARPIAAPAAVMAMLVLYAATLDRVGFDLATFLFVAGSLLAQGERRPLVVLVFPAVFALLVVWMFKSMLTLNMPTWLL